jgi:hypothetical protein
MDPRNDAGVFLTCTQNLVYIHGKFNSVFTKIQQFSKKKNPSLRNNPILLTWRASFFALADKFPSTLVSGLPTAPPLGFHPFSPFSHPQFILHYLHRPH